MTLQSSHPSVNNVIHVTDKWSTVNHKLPPPLDRWLIRVARVVTIIRVVSFVEFATIIGVVGIIKDVRIFRIVRFVRVRYGTDKGTASTVNPAPPSPA